MEYLLLWSGDKRGMKKSRIPAREHNGVYGHWRDGKLFVPDLAAVRAALPFRYRKAHDRNAAIWFDRDSNDAPATQHLSDSRGRPLLTLYLQPLKD